MHPGTFPETDDLSVHVDHLWMIRKRVRFSDKSSQTSSDIASTVCVVTNHHLSGPRPTPGRLCTAALLSSYGKKVVVCESHTQPGGCAHGFDRSGYKFDSGPSLFSGMYTRKNTLYTATNG